MFDFFGVIGSEIAPSVLPRYMSAEAAVTYKASVVERADHGDIGFADVLEHLSHITGVASAVLEVEFWNCVKIDGEIVALIERLKPRYRTALLSNAMAPFLRQLMKKHDLERLFDTMVISCEDHVTKPDPAIYQLMIERLGVPASACYFTDDNPTNVEAARQAGMQASLFTDLDALKADLAQRGIL